jgi:hypothetical protein
VLSAYAWQIVISDKNRGLGVGDAREAGVKAYAGRWRIVSMESWNAGYFDMEVAAHLTIGDDLSGEFQFGLVQSRMKGRMSAKSHYRFTWSGFDENDPVSGRGWLQADGELAEGLIEFDLGEKAKLVARRERRTR